MTRRPPQPKFVARHYAKLSAAQVRCLKSAAAGDMPEVRGGHRSHDGTTHGLPTTTALAKKRLVKILEDGVGDGYVRITESGLEELKMIRWQEQSASALLDGDGDLSREAKEVLAKSWPYEPAWIPTLKLPPDSSVAAAAEEVGKKSGFSLDHLVDMFARVLGRKAVRLETEHLRAASEDPEGVLRKDSYDRWNDAVVGLLHEALFVETRDLGSVRLTRAGRAELKRRENGGLSRKLSQDELLCLLDADCGLNQRHLCHKDGPLVWIKPVIHPSPAEWSCDIVNRLHKMGLVDRDLDRRMVSITEFGREVLGVQGRAAGLDLSHTICEAP